jgi:hypothetical protein
MSIKRIGIRFNLTKEADRKVWEQLQNADKSYSKVVISAVNEYFEDLSAAEKEDAFLERVLETIWQGMQTAAPLGLLQLLGQAQQPQPSKEETAVEQAENDNAALEFLDSI